MLRSWLNRQSELTIALLVLLGVATLTLTMHHLVRPALAQAPAPQTPSAEHPTTPPADPAPSGTTPAGHEPAAGEHPADHGKFSPHPLWILPFVALLGCIALMPLINMHFWEHRYPYFAAVFFLIGLGYYLLVRGDLHPWLHEMKEYVSFIALLFALFTVSAGVLIHISRKATPMANATLLLIGAVIANIFGTTGAAMLLIRPYIRINRGHIKPFHIVFFIFLVANVGGCLTPIGDPPLFLGYLKGVPFWWVLEHCWQPWAVATLILLVIFYILDRRDHAGQERAHPSEHDTGPAVRINGIHNLLFILIVLVGVFQESVFEALAALGEQGVTAGGLLGVLLSREVIMVAAALASKRVTRQGIYEQNEFTWAPIREVAILFVAIFSVMVPALEWLDANAEKMPMKNAGHFYFVTGTLSSVLDNAPTYLTFLQTELGDVEMKYPDELKTVQAELATMKDKQSLHIRADLPPAARAALVSLVKYHNREILTGHVPYDEVRIAFLTGLSTKMLYLIAISCGAVFFGAMTYIGNAPNFMVKSIAESAGIKMPSFLGYVFRYSLTILLPVLVVVWAIFFLNKG